VYGPFQRAVEGVMRDRVELIAELDRLAARLDDREGPAIDADDVGVRSVVAFGARAGGNFFAKHLTGFGAADPAVAVPVGLSALDADAVDHAGAGEPVIARGVGGDRWVRAVAEVAAGQAGGDLAVDAEFLERELFGHRRVDAGEVRVRVGGAGEAFAVEIGDLADALGDGAADQAFNVACHCYAP
jgi:hypothetical protein